MLIDTPIPTMAMPLMVAMDKIDLTDAEANGGVIEKEFKLGHMAKSKTCDFSVTFNSEEISGIHGSMQVKYKASATPPAVNYGGTSDSWSYSYSWGGPIHSSSSSSSSSSSYSYSSSSGSSFSSSATTTH